MKQKKTNCRSKKQELRGSILEEYKKIDDALAKAFKEIKEHFNIK